MNVEKINEIMTKVRKNIGKVIVGKENTVDYLLTALIASGHVLLEDVPGTGKTLMAKALSKSLALKFRRIQFTPDLLPSDASGINFFNQKKGEFEFREGPLFANLVLADEINRATPRTQAVLLESMEERQLTIDGTTHPLQQPFLVIATQNPIESQGTFPLPEAQLDRFLLKITLGYPSREEGLEILKRYKGYNPIESLEPVAAAEDIVFAQKEYAKVYVSDDMLSYILDIVERTRMHPDVVLGVSPRGSQALLKSVQAFAILKGRNYVLPDDVKALVKPVLGHRLLLKQMMLAKGNPAEGILDSIVNEMIVPSEEAIVKELQG
nr:MoxR family ATPase [Evansella caseinilytica]